MPRHIVTAEEHDRGFSLGFLANEWMEYFVRHGPGDVRKQPVVHGDEYVQFIVDCYALSRTDPQNTHRLYDSGFLSRPKGCDKSGLGARFCLFEAFGPCRYSGQAAEGGEVYTDPWGLGFAYEYAPGEPMGRPVTDPFVRICATADDQNTNVYRTIYLNLTDDDCPLYWVGGHDTGKSAVILRNGGEIRTTTAAAASKDGGLETFCVADEVHLYTTDELREMLDTITRNIDKRKQGAGTWWLETTTMFQPGENSAAEATFKEAELIRQGLKKRGGARLLFDHRYGVVADLADEAALRAGLIEAYGDAMAYKDLDAMVSKAYDTRTSESSTRRYALNGRTSARTAWIKEEQWDACGRADLALRDRDTVTLGLDASLNEDATALVACRVSDGHIELLACWQPDDSDTDPEAWQIDKDVVDAEVAHAMRRFTVVGFYADPPHIDDYIARWTARWGEKMKVRAQVGKPLSWWTNRPAPMAAALLAFKEAILQRHMSFTPAADRTGRQAELAEILKTHVLNARERIKSGPGGQGPNGEPQIQIAKEHQKSAKKIDAAVSAVLAWSARRDAIAASVGRKQPFAMAKRLR